MQLRLNDTCVAGLWLRVLSSQICWKVNACLQSNGQQAVLPTDNLQGSILVGQQLMAKLIFPHLLSSRLRAWFAYCMALLPLFPAMPSVRLHTGSFGSEVVYCVVESTVERSQSAEQCSWSLRVIKPGMGSAQWISTYCSSSKNFVYIFCRWIAPLKRHGSVH